MYRFALFCCCVLAAGLAPAAAQTTAPSPAPTATATTPSPIAEKIVAAIAKQTSFRIALSTASGMGGVMTYVVPQQRMKALMAAGPMMFEGVFADGASYMRINGGDWRRIETSATATTSTPMKALVDPTKIHPLADRVENGVTVGVYESSVTPPPGTPFGTQALALTCTYDKTTYLPRTCTNDRFTQTFEGWNDPANVVDVPVVATPAPAASPHP